ncbi:MAG: ATP-binding protein [Comamonas sp.]
MQPEILNLIFAGESDSLELKTSIRDPILLAKLIGSFANGKGGKIVVGVKEPPEVVGVDDVLARQVYEAAQQRITPKPKTELSFIEAEGKRVAVITVERSSEIVLSDGRAFVRTGTMTKPMAWTQMRQHLPVEPSTSTIESLTKLIERKSTIIEGMDKRLEKSSSIKERAKEWGAALYLAS